MSYSRLRAAAKALLVIVACCAFGGWLLWIGVTALMEGQITIHPRRAASYTAYPTGNTSGSFHFKVWIAILVGTMVLALGLALASLLVFGSERSRDQALRRLAAHRLAGNSPQLPTWVTVVVIVCLVVFLVFVAIRWHLPA